MKKVPLVVLLAVVLAAGTALYWTGFHFGHQFYGADDGPTKAGYSQWMAVYRRMVFAKIDTDVPYSATKRPQWMRAKVAQIYHGSGAQSLGPTRIRYTFRDGFGNDIGEDPFEVGVAGSRARAGDELELYVNAEMVRSGSAVSKWLATSITIAAPPWVVRCEVLKVRPLADEEG